MVKCHEVTPKFSLHMHLMSAGVCLFRPITDARKKPQFSANGCGRVVCGHVGNSES